MPDRASILSIPGNEEPWKRLIALLRSGDAIAWVGAGASAGLYPLWGDLLDELIDRVRAARSVDPARLDRWKADGATDPLEVARRIRKALDDGRFFGFLRDRFAPPSAGSAFTATHAALADLPFGGFVTTNYDVGLTLALSRKGAFAPPASWKDAATLASWMREEATGPARPVLHAHGFYERVDTLVLDRERYEEAYGSRAFRQLFEKLWTGGKLVSVGFSFADPWLDVLAGEVVRSSGQMQVIAPGHVAIVGVDASSTRDGGYLEDLRGKLESIYHGNVLVYPVGAGHDHSALLALLEAARVEVESETVTGVTAGPSVLERWLDLVAEEHRLLIDRFERPAGLDVVEAAWVQLELAPAVEISEGDGTAERLRPRLEHAELETFLAYRRDDEPWVTGRWLVEGDPGSGKTTLLRRLAARTAGAQRGDGAGRVPLFLSLPRLVEPLRMPLDYVREEVGRTCGNGLAEALDAEGRGGRLLVLLDALDEVPSERRERVDKVLAWLAREWPEASIVLSSRPLGLGPPPAGFVKLSLQPLRPEDRQSFLAKWFSSATAAEVAARHFDGEPSLRSLSLNPLHLTLLAELWQRGVAAPVRRSDLYDAIFRMLLQGDRREVRKRRVEPVEATRQALRHIAYAHTEEDLPTEAVEKLEDRLLDPALEEAHRKITRVWPSHRAFFDAVGETAVLAPHDGPKEPWRFWHRTFREALVAERLAEKRDAAEEDFLARVEALEDEDEGRWAEPFALLAGRPGGDRLIVELARRRPSLGVRALETAQGLAAETLVELLDVLEDPDHRGTVFEAIPAQLDTAEAALDLIERLRLGTCNGNDLYFLDRACFLAGERWPESTEAARQQRDRLFDHIPLDEAGRRLLERFRTADGQEKDLWCDCPKGVYPIGSDDHNDSEKPRHPVQIVRPYAMAAVTITNAQYALFDPGKAPRRWEGVPEAELAEHPRVEVTWWEAMSFCRWLSRQPGFEGAQLPSEEEWEVACRAGSATEYWNGDGDAALGEVGWYEGNQGKRRHRVAEKRANDWGLYDVHGNVWEWTADVWDAERYRGRSADDPFPVEPAAEPADSAASPRAGRVARGGSCWDPADWARSACRGVGDPKLDFEDRGFRVLLPFPRAGSRG